jgi:cyclic dehypoxanthinyl futalosine synthase
VTTRISVDEARELWLHASDDELQRLAQEVRARYHEPKRATYMVMRIINYTNVCVAQCDYCAFYVLPNQDGGYVLSREDVFAKIDELLEFGGDLVGFNGGFNPRCRSTTTATCSRRCASATATASSSTR